MMKHLRYFKYVCRHKWFVFRAGLKTGAPLWRLIIHDYSKFSRAEWTPYANRFFSGNSGKLDKTDDPKEFLRAWTHHWNNNPHHWEYWLATRKDGSFEALDMPDHFIKEMVADWLGAGRAITGSWDMKEWWDKSHPNMQLHPRVALKVQQILIGLNYGRS